MNHAWITLFGLPQSLFGSKSMFDLVKSLKVPIKYSISVICNIVILPNVSFF